MEVSDENTLQQDHQLLQPKKLLQYTNTVNTPSSSSNDTEKGSVPPLFGLPTTNKQSVPPIMVPTTEKQHAPTLLSLPTTTRHTVVPGGLIATSKQTTPSLYSFGAVTKQDVLLPQWSPITTHTSIPVRPEVPRKGKTSRLDRSTPFIAVLLNLVVLGSILMMSQYTMTRLPTYQASTSSTPVKTAPPALNTITNNKDISPLIFGTNMALFHENDEPILNSAVTRQRLKDIGVRVIRMPTRTSLSPQTEVKAAQAIKEIGAVPLIVMGGPEFKEGPLLDHNMQLLNLLMPVFGNEPVYFEFGNESDLNGVTVDQYIASWNEVIPPLKAKFPNARFIAPDNYQFTRRYLKTFLQHAQPRPDGVSWHEYTCSVNWTAEFCLSLLDMWPIHFAQARAAMREAIGTELPIWVSEWNYASDQQLNNGKPVEDGKYNNPTFMHAWTTRAMQLLIENRVFASLQYFATDEPMALVTNEKISFEGDIFQQHYKDVMVKGHTPPVMTVSEPPAVVPKIPLAVAFGNGVAPGWYVIGAGISQPVISNGQTFVGPYSLRVTLSNASEDAFPILSISHTALPMIPKPGQMISAYVYVENKQALVNAKFYVAEPNRSWHFSGDMTLTPGQWNKVWYALPVNFTGQVADLGIQFFTSRPGVSSNVYVGGLSIG